MNVPFLLPVALLVICMLARLLLLIEGSELRSTAWKYRKWIVVLVMAGTVIKWPYGAPFLGLEYEDAYVYSASAKFALHSVPITPTPYVLTGCSVGTLDDCQKQVSYSGHTIGFPAIIAAVSRFTGFNPFVASYLSLAASVLCGLVIFSLGLLIDSAEYATSAAVISFTIPVFNVFATSSFSEPFSSIFVVLSILVFIRCFHPKRSWGRLCKVLNWVLLSGTLWLAVLLKRENIVLLGVLPATYLVYRWTVHRSAGTTQSESSRILCCFGALTIFLSIFYVYVLDVESIIGAEGPDVNGFPFSISFSSRLIP